MQQATFNPAVAAARQEQARKKDPVCHKCTPPGGYPIHLDLAWHGEVEGIETFDWVCPNCTGHVTLQVADNPQTGKPMVRQVALNGNPREYQPHDSFALQVSSAQGWERQFDLTDEISPAFAVSRLDVMARMPGSFFNQHVQNGMAAAGFSRPQAPVPARTVTPHPMQPHPAMLQAQQQKQQRLYQQQLAAAQANGAMLAQQGYQPLQQPVAYTLGSHPAPVRPPHPNAMRRRVLGLPPVRHR